MAEVYKTLLVAMTKSGVIGRDGKMPWKQSADLKRFQKMTWGKPLVMGRKTFDSLGKPLAGRPNFVVTRNPSFIAPAGVHVCGTFEEAILQAQELSQHTDQCELYIIGGGEIYRQAMVLADYIMVTQIDADVHGDTVFPEINSDEWEEYLRVPGVEVDEKNQYPTTYVSYAKKK